MTHGTDNTPNNPASAGCPEMVAEVSHASLPGCAAAAAATATAAATAAACDHSSALLTPMTQCQMKCEKEDESEKLVYPPYMIHHTTG